MPVTRHHPELSELPGARQLGHEARVLNGGLRALFTKNVLARHPEHRQVFCHGPGFQRGAPPFSATRDDSWGHAFVVGQRGSRDPAGTGAGEPFRTVDPTAEHHDGIQSHGPKLACSPRKVEGSLQFLEDALIGLQWSVMLQRWIRRSFLATLAVLGGALLIPGPVTTASVDGALPRGEPEASELALEDLDDSRAEGCHERPLRAPNGSPPRLTCAEARAILSEVHALYAGPTDAFPAQAFPDLVAGWLDPHGLWSAAPDAPLARSLGRYAAELAAELRQSPVTQEPCRAAGVLGAELKSWISELSHIYDESVLQGRTAPARHQAFNGFAEPMFQDDPVTRPARVLARRLGERIGSFVAKHPESGVHTARAARDRYFPELPMDAWAEVVLAAAVRAYVPLLDPHGGWAPFDEEWSLYSEDPGFDAGPRLWGEVARTAVAIRVLSDALPPLQNGDLVLAVDGVATVGMPLEQIEQLGRLEPEEGSVRRILALNREDSKPEELYLNVAADLDPGDRALTLEAERIAFGDGIALVVRIPDVPEGLGESLGRLIAERRSPVLSGILLDLRGNGGGSTEAAASVLGLFLPGAPLFPLSTRGRMVEVMHAAEPPEERRWDGPVAALVDGYTASAAEMIAGGLSAYGRGVLLGQRTFGKGCIQEYAEDHTGRGVLRVTTLLYALPDGNAVQRTGVVPDILLPLARAVDREADIGGALPGYFGPDVREKGRPASVSWPAHHAHVGSFSDAVVVSALRRLGAPSLVPRTVAARRANPRAKGALSVVRP